MKNPGKEEALLNFAHKIRDLGLSTPVVVLLEMHKPICGLLHSVALLGQPFATMLFGARLSSLIVEVLESPEGISRFIELLESPEYVTAKGVVK